ncbi:DUF5131 family protein [Marinibaculum pumilum]|uniref:DUF5131 family protein n=1 Tax=Marinibaculum pumilum TaxID=1766165 RepID=A0ABV7KYA1_9PROT
MADDTKIEWTDATVNFWWGCTKVGPGCDGCYAEAWDRRAGGAHWGQGVPRRKIKSAVQTLHRLDNGYSWWAADHAIGKINPTLRRRVFLQSMSDMFDLEVPLDWFREAWETIEACDRLALQILTKRVSAVEKRLDAIGRTEWPQHAGLMITVVNQPEAARDVPRLLALKERLRIPWVGLSCEPLLGPIDLRPWLPGCYECAEECGWRSGTAPPEDVCHACGWIGTNAGEFCCRCGKQDFGSVCPRCEANAVHQHPDTPTLDWVIAGGESGGGARPPPDGGFDSLRDQCTAAGVAFFLKQHGEWIGVRDLRNLPGGGGPGFGAYDHCPYDREAEAVRVGKRRAGRMLDGQVWDQIPATHQEGANR